MTSVKLRLEDDEAGAQMNPILKERLEESVWRVMEIEPFQSVHGVRRIRFALDQVITPAERAKMGIRTPTRYLRRRK